MNEPIRLTVNGEHQELSVAGDKTLLWVLREELELTGTKGACLEGECGSCTVLLDGISVNACLVLANQADGQSVVTVEGLAPGGDKLSPIQQAFIDGGGFQCGFCTAGFLVQLTALLAEDDSPTSDSIRHGLEGNLCRCTGYLKIIEAALAASERIRGTM
jgi:carbon-monoxide dehydrogenase small subunit